MKSVSYTHLAMGLDIISFNVQNFVDSNQVIENLGIDNIVKIKKSAAIARANSEKEIKIAQARANKEALSLIHILPIPECCQVLRCEDLLRTKSTQRTNKTESVSYTHLPQK